MANEKKLSVFGGGFVQKACQSRSVLITAREARIKAASEAFVARCCYCGGNQGLRFVEVSPRAMRMDAGELSGFAFQWMCYRCRQPTLF